MDASPSDLNTDETLEVAIRLPVGFPVEGTVPAIPVAADIWRVERNRR